jgi:tetratricopeptide (TPR) repeat protein
MLPPLLMLAKINSAQGLFFALALSLSLAGCTPAGPRALWKGKYDLDHNDLPGAVTQLKRATTLLATNASAWNYLGVALHRAGQADDAATAYQTALRLDRDLVEAHFNLGVLCLEQNRSDAAKAELTAYTLQRPNDAAGWLRLGFAQLKSGGDTLAAERSFSKVLSLKIDEAAAYNGLGLASLQSGKPRDAAKFFVAASQARPDYAPALQNLATVNLEYLHDNKAALAGYKSYLALAQRPANYDEVKALAASLAQSDVAATVMAPAVVTKTVPPPEPKPKVASALAPHPPPAPQVETENTAASHAPERTTTAANPAPAPPAVVTTQVASQSAKVQPASATETAVTLGTKTNRPVHVAVAAAAKPAVNDGAPAEPAGVAMTEEDQPRPGFWHRLFGTNKSPGNAKSRYGNENLKPIPGGGEEMAGTKPAARPEGAKPHPSARPGYYSYTAPARPAAGDRRAAEEPFSKAQTAEKDEDWNAAEQGYLAAAEADPSWFEAQYNAGVIAHRLRHYSVALPRYELALALQPESTDARYNFALALRASGFAADAADELKKVLVLNPDEIRAHLALANICAQSLHDIPQARQHYKRVLDLQPDIAQAADIRFWLSANAKR